jgi:S-(hydroxymethyl)glutathione dehydrogenase/alcohol dehydrogenase
VTTFNEYTICAENRITRLPEGFPMHVAPLFGCAVTTGFGVINNKARVKIGQSIAVFGAGGVGLSMVQGAAMSGAFPIIAVDKIDARLELAEALGASHLINSSREDMSACVRKIAGTQGVDVAVDNTGISEVIQSAYNLTKPQGKTILVGVPPKGETTHLYTLPLHFGKELTGTKGGECNPAEDIANYIRLYQTGRLELDRLITSRYPLVRVNEAIEDMRAGRTVGRVILKINGP